MKQGFSSTPYQGRRGITNRKSFNFACSSPMNNRLKKIRHHVMDILRYKKSMEVLRGSS